MLARDNERLSDCLHHHSKHSSDCFVVTEYRLVKSDFDVTKIVTYDRFEVSRVCRIRVTGVAVTPLRSLVRLPYTNRKAL